MKLATRWLDTYALKCNTKCQDLTKAKKYWLYGVKMLYIVLNVNISAVPNTTVY